MKLNRRTTFVAVSAASLVFAGISSAAVPTFAAGNGEPITCQTPARGTQANAVAKSLVTKFFTLIRDKDQAGMSKFMDQAWLSLTSNGTSRDHNSFVNDMPTVNDFTIDHITARLHDAILTTRYMAKVTGSIAGHPYSSDFAPRLSTFSYCSGAWKMVSQGNFDPLIRDPKPAS